MHAGKALVSVAIHNTRRVNIMAKASRGERAEDVGLERRVEQAATVIRGDDHPPREGQGVIYVVFSLLPFRSSWNVAFRSVFRPARGSWDPRHAKHRIISCA
jgi:hypothetical protein